MRVVSSFSKNGKEEISSNDLVSKKNLQLFEVTNWLFDISFVFKLQTIIPMNHSHMRQTRKCHMKEFFIDDCLSIQS